MVSCHFDVWLVDGQGLYLIATFLISSTLQNALALQLDHGPVISLNELAVLSLGALELLFCALLNEDSGIVVVHFLDLLDLGLVVANHHYQRRFQLLNCLHDGEQTQVVFNHLGAFQHDFLRLRQILSPSQHCFQANELVHEAKLDGLQVASQGQVWVWIRANLVVLNEVDGPDELGGDVHPIDEHSHRSDTHKHDGNQTSGSRQDLNDVVLHPLVLQLLIRKEEERPEQDRSLLFFVSHSIGGDERSGIVHGLANPLRADGIVQEEVEVRRQPDEEAVVVGGHLIHADEVVVVPVGVQTQLELRMEVFLGLDWVTPRHGVQLRFLRQDEEREVNLAEKASNLVG